MGGEQLDPATMRRLTLYTQYLQKLRRDIDTVTPKEIAEGLLLDPKLVRQDMKLLLGRERVTAESREALHAAIATHTVTRKVRGVVLVGVGKLGSALMSYAGFSAYDLDILAGFDVSEKIIKKGAYGKPVYHMSRLPELCRRLDAKVGVITTPGGAAQEVCDTLIESGVAAIWNFTSASLKAPPRVLIHNEDMSKSLLRLMKHAEK